MSTDTTAEFTTLLLALRDLDMRNESTPCQTPGADHLWTSDNPDEREAACHRCQHCPLRLTACADYTTTGNERHHVWAGADLTPSPRKKEARR